MSFAALALPVHASMRVLAKNGFVQEGIERLFAYEAGRMIDRVIWATYRALEGTS